MIGLYFSGTGNTGHCIKTFLDACGKGLPAYSIEDVRSIAALREARRIILGYPVYFSNIPKIMKDFIIEHGALFAGKEVFIIATMGLFSGDGAGCAARILKKNGAGISGGLHLQMPDCIGDVKLLKRSKDANRQLVSRAEAKCRNAAAAYLNGAPTQNGMGAWPFMAGFFGQRLWFLGNTRTYSDKLKIDTSKCKGCGLCAAACPMFNLSMGRGVAVPGARCTMCYRCVGLCPNRAITLIGRAVVEQCRVENYLE